MTAAEQRPQPTIAIIGAGFAGLGMGYYLKQAGLNNFTIFEKAQDLGGVWRENTYPGAACDVPSHLYSFSFEPHYPWSRAYGPQKDIFAYQHMVAKKYGILGKIRFGREVLGAEFDEARGVWTIWFSDETSFEAHVLISAVGQLHRPSFPPVEGIEKFKGVQFHSANWNHDFEFFGKTVASIGTGPSAIQYVPEIAQQTDRLYVFQRSPAWCVPKFDREYTRVEKWLLKHWPWTHTLDRLRIFWYAEFVASVVQKKSMIQWLSKWFAETLAKLLLKLQVKDPELRRKLTPDFPVGCKRLLFSNDWYRTLAKDNVELVTEPITEITETGVVTADGQHREVDAIVYGTGFTATQFLAPMDFKGLKGALLSQRWKDGAQAYLGMTVSGFPNFFVLYGPNTNLGIGTIIFMLERQQRYIARCVEILRDRGLRYMDVRADAENAFKRELDERSQSLAYVAGCHSWYLTNGRNTNNWVGYMTEYGRRLKRPQLDAYTLVSAAVTA
ncbi:MAG TPA: NAD(P)/FAD-dependent oxidoreductase [Nevskiaceae bacterium]|nr:NAD(P)/FAD-dependent oxidoreductase [Nevskiaceae bacterium]